MKNRLWIGFCLLLLLLNIALVLEIMRNKRQLSSEIADYEKACTETRSEDSSLIRLIIYFSETSCFDCMQEALYWNKLFLDFSREEICVIGLVPENEDPHIIKERHGILFPVYRDEKGKFAKRFNIAFTPFKILIDINENLRYLDQSLPSREIQESFYYEVIEHMNKVRVKEALRKMAE